MPSAATAARCRQSDDSRLNDPSRRRPVDGHGPTPSRADQGKAHYSRHGCPVQAAQKARQEKDEGPRVQNVILLPMTAIRRSIGDALLEQHFSTSLNSEPSTGSYSAGNGPSMHCMGDPRMIIPLHARCVSPSQNCISIATVGSLELTEHRSLRSGGLLPPTATTASCRHLLLGIS